MADRPAFPGTIPFGTKVIVTGQYGDYRAKLVAARNGVTGAVVLVEDEYGSQWVARDRVRLAPPPWPVRARAWVKSFLFGEK